MLALVLLLPKTFLEVIAGLATGAGADTDSPSRSWLSVLTRGAADFVVAVVTDAAAGDLVAVTVLGAAAVAVAWDFEGAGFISLKIKIHNPAEFVAQYLWFAQIRFFPYLAVANLSRQMQHKAGKHLF